MRLIKNITILFVLLLSVSCIHHTPIEGTSLLKSYAQVDPVIDSYLDRSVAYVIFPHIQKAAVGIGGAYGRGEVYRKDLLGYSLVGYAELNQVNAGLQLGAQSYSEIIFFENHTAFERFKASNLQFTADASAVLLENARRHIVVYSDGVATVILKKEGLMGELSIGGQKLSYQAL
jgi:lipid-binding SYLF domain-containing protein